jgi:hypothetical protein
MAELVLISMVKEYMTQQLKDSNSPQMVVREKSQQIGIARRNVSNV